MPIETTFDSVRKPSQSFQSPGGPNPELTPDPSPKSASPQPPEPRPKRRFAPQLVETSRRARRVGDAGPATKPTDKTDITPYTNHIYTSRPRARRKNDDADPDRPSPPTRRETEEAFVLEYLLELAKKQSEKQIQEAALAAFPNSRAREGGVAHFYYDEGSGSDLGDDGFSSPKPAAHRPGRKSSDQDMGWWQQHMQQHAQQLAHDRGEDLTERDEDVIMESDEHLDKMDLSTPPDPLWTTASSRAAAPPQDRRDSTASTPRALVGGESHTLASAYSAPSTVHQSKKRQAEPVERDLCDAPQPRRSRDGELPGSAAPLRIPVETGFQNSKPSPFATPFGNFLKPHDPKVQKMQKLASPPMQGKDLTFRRCPSPKLTKLQPNHPFSHHGAEDLNRDATGQAGLWRGYCFRTDSKDAYLAPSDLKGPAMIKTPHPPETPREGDASSSSGSDDMCLNVAPAAAGAATTGVSVGVGHHRGKSQAEAKGVHMLAGLDERLRHEVARLERDEKIAQEFNDEFVTQVYNYLSLGYPATAGGFDEELSRISKMSVDELRRNDGNQMAKGHMLEMNLDETPEAARCPRWKALRIYVLEWARQHPDLDSLDPLSWWVRERRGSWAI